MWQDIKNFFFWIFSGELSQNQKICTTISLAWIIFIGYLTWWNGLKSFAVDKSFRWDEWFWFCLLYTSPSPRDATLSRMPSSA